MTDQTTTPDPGDNKDQTGQRRPEQGGDTDPSRTKQDPATGGEGAAGAGGSGGFGT